MMTPVKMAVMAALCGVLSPVAGRAVISDQTGYRSESDLGEPRFSIDVVDFRAADTGMITLTVSYKIFYDALSYQKVGSGYQASYELAVLIVGESGAQIGGEIKQSTITVDTYGETTRGTDFIINLLEFTVSEQNYTVRAVLTDSHAGTKRELAAKGEAQSYWGRYPAVSRILFAREFHPPEENSRFTRHGSQVIPCVTRLFGGDIDSLLRFYIEVYPGTGEEQYGYLVTRIYHRTRGFVYADTSNYGEVLEPKYEARMINVAHIAPGDYELEIRIEGRRGKSYDKIIEPFEMELTAETVYRNDFKQAVAMLKYIATRDETKDLLKAKTPEEQSAAWNRFWKSRNAERRSAQHPTKEEYFRRIRHANRNFSFMKKDGWKTTRGMVYVVYGAPDEVEDHPFELDEKPFQTWHYFRLSPPRQFLFIDEWGDGNYELQPPYDGVN